MYLLYNTLSISVLLELNCFWLPHGLLLNDRKMGTIVIPSNSWGLGGGGTGESEGSKLPTSHILLSQLLPFCKLGDSKHILVIRPLNSKTFPLFLDKLYSALLILLTFFDSICTTCAVMLLYISWPDIATVNFTGSNPGFFFLAQAQILHFSPILLS